jgi:valyl-tRNA synthetase
MRVEKGVDARRKIAAWISAGEEVPTFKELEASLCVLAGIDPESLFIQSSIDETPADSIPAVAHGIEIYLPLQGLLDVQEEAQRLRAQLEEAHSQIQRLQDLLAGPFAKRAPEEVIQKERDRLIEYEATASKLQAQLDGLPPD